jgi:hypothetical protein
LLDVARVEGGLASPALRVELAFPQKPSLVSTIFALAIGGARMSSVVSTSLQSSSTSAVAAATPPDEAASNRSFDGSRCDWLTKAARLPGKSLHLAMALQLITNAQRTDQVALSNVALQQFGLTRNAKYRALGWLEKAGLVRVECKLGRSPLVTLLDCSDAP